MQTARKRVEALAREAVATHVLPHLGARGRDFEVTIPLYGRSSLVYLVDVAGGASFALRVEPSWQRYLAFRQRRRATLFWTRRGLPTPRLLYEDLSPLTRLKTGLFLLAEERVEGGNVVDQGPESGAFEALGRALARVHALTRSWHHGALFRPKLGGYAHHFRRRNRERSRELEHAGVLTNTRRQKLDRWFESFEPALRSLKVYSLIHRRCTESDVMFGVSGEASILEPYRSGFGVFATDLVRAEQRICRGDPDRIARLHEAYFAAAPAVFTTIYEQLAPAFRAELHLGHARRWAGKNAGLAAETEKKCSAELESLQRISGV